MMIKGPKDMFAASVSTTLSQLIPLWRVTCSNTAPPLLHRYLSAAVLSVVLHVMLGSEGTRA